MMTSKREKRVGIIGGGPAGIVSVKSCLEEGLEPICFEQFDKIGGVWYYTDEYREGQGARAFENMTANVCKDMLAFSDFPMSDDTPPYPTCDHVRKYLQEYCDHFQLNDHIHLNTKVTRVRKTDDHETTGKWEVHTEGKDGAQKHIFDFVIIGSGFYKKARIPDIPGLDTFSGTISHSQKFKNGAEHKGKRVLVVGNGNSAGDVTTFTAMHATQVYLSIGKGAYVMQRLGHKGLPWDFNLYKRSNFFSLSKGNKLVTDYLNGLFNLKDAGILPKTPPLSSSLLVNDEIQMKLMNGKVKVVEQLKRVGPSEVEFKDGTVIENLDAIIFATGFNVDLDYLEEKLSDETNKMELFKMMFPYRLSKSTLALVGFQDIYGGQAPAAELQARYISRVFAGNLELPPRSQMEADVEKLNTIVLETHGRYKYNMPYLPFRDELATLLGVMPTWLDLVKSPRLAHLFYYEPAFPYHFRLWGPHTWPGAREAIEKALKEGHYAKQYRKDPGSP